MHWKVLSTFRVPPSRSIGMDDRAQIEYDPPGRWEMAYDSLWVIASACQPRRTMGRLEGGFFRG